MDPSRSSSKNQQKVNKKKKDGETTQRQRAPNWSIDQTTVMLNLVREEQLNLRVTGPGTFTKQFWNKIAPLLSAQSDPPRQGLELHGRWKTLKSEFYDYKHLADKSGWGWDPDKKVPSATDECWEEYKKICHVFKDALGAIDGTHISALVKKKKKERFRNRKGFISQNVLAACSFDMLFLYVAVGWEGSASDMKVLRWAMEDGGFAVPNGRYYLGDLGFANTSKILCPYRNHPYHPGQITRRYVVPEDLYNHRHAQLRNVIERTFGVLKVRFKLLDRMPRYKYRKQTLIVMACCIIHNFIRIQKLPDKFFDTAPTEYPPDNENLVDQEDLPHANDISAGEIIRNNIKNTLWRERRRRRN